MISKFNLSANLRGTLIGPREKLRGLVKDVLLKTGGVSTCVRYLHAQRVKQRYARTVARYRRIPLTTTSERLLEERSKAALQRIRSATELEILFIGTDYLQDHSGMLNALQELGRVTVFYQEDGTYGNSAYRSLTKNGRIEARIVHYLEAAKAAGAPIHVIIGQMWAGYVDPERLAQLRDAYGVLIINICMDDRHAFDTVVKAGVPIGTRLLAPNIDLALTAAPEAVEWHLKEGCPAFFFPEASSPTIFASSRGARKEFDVSFVGAAYGVRKKIVRALSQAGIHVMAYGDGWPNGRIDAQDVTALFAKSKIILGVGAILDCDDFVALKLRDFDAPMSGSFYLTTYNEDLRTLFELGKELETYSSIAECVDKCRYYLQHEDERENIARRGFERAHSQHTWSQRFLALGALLAGKAEKMQI